MLDVGKIILFSNIKRVYASRLVMSNLNPWSHASNLTSQIKLLRKRFRLQEEEYRKQRESFKQEIMQDKMRCTEKVQELNRIKSSLTNTNTVVILLIKN